MCAKQRGEIILMMWNITTIEPLSIPRPPNRAPGHPSCQIIVCCKLAVIASHLLQGCEGDILLTASFARLPILFSNLPLCAPLRQSQRGQSHPFSAFKSSWKETAVETRDTEPFTMPSLLSEQLGFKMAAMSLP